MRLRVTSIADFDGSLEEWIMVRQPPTKGELKGLYFDSLIHALEYDVGYKNSAHTESHSTHSTLPFIGEMAASLVLGATQWFI